MKNCFLCVCFLLVAPTACGQEPATPTPAAEPDRAAQAQEHLKAGIARLEANDPRGALRDLVLATEFAPGIAEAHYALGVAWFQLDEHEKARAALETALDRDRKHVGALEHLGRVLYAENRLGDARERWKAALEIDPSHESVKRLLEKLDREAPVEGRFDERFTQHFRIKLEGGGKDDAALADRAGEALERAYSDVGYKLGHYPSRPIPVILYADRDFYSVTGSHGWVSGLFDGKIRIPVKDAFKSDPTALARVIVHEYVHACVFTLAPRCPTWLQEGLAQHFEGGRNSRGLEELRAAASREDGLPAMEKLASEFTPVGEKQQVNLLYAQSLSFVDFLIARRGAGEIAAFLRELGAGATVPAAAERVYGAPLAELEAEWRATLR